MANVNPGIHIFAYGLTIGDLVMNDRCPSAMYCGYAQVGDQRFHINQYGLLARDSLRAIMRAASKWAFPEEYIRELSSWLEQVA